MDLSEILFFFIYPFNHQITGTQSPGGAFMKTLLRIQTSLQGSKGQSSQLADRFVERWLRNNPGGRIVTRDLSRDTVPHLTAERFAAFAASDGERTGDQQAALALSDALI